MSEELIVLLHAGFAGGARRHIRAEFLEMHTYSVKSDVAAAIRTFDSSHYFFSVLLFA